MGETDDTTPSMSNEPHITPGNHDYTLCSEKNTQSQILSYLHEWCVNLNKNFSEHTQGTVYANNVKIRHSLWPMTYLRHIFWLKLERVYSKR